MSGGYDNSRPHEYCVVHDQPADWCEDPGETRWGAYVAQRLTDLKNGVGDFTDLKRPAVATVEHARRVAAEHFRATTPTPSVVPTADGEIDFVWHKNGHDVELTVGAEDALLWVYDRTTGVMWDGSLSEFREGHLQRLLDALEGGASPSNVGPPA